MFMTKKSKRAHEGILCLISKCINIVLFYSKKKRNENEMYEKNKNIIQIIVSINVF